VLFRELDDAMGIAHTLIRRAWFALELEDYDYLRLLHEEALSRARAAGDKIIIAWIHYDSGRVCWKKDRDLEQARNHLENGLLLFREAQFQVGCNVTLTMLAFIEQEVGNVDHAQKYLEENLFSMWKNTPNSHFLPFVLAELANIAKAQGKFERATVLLGAAGKIALSARRDASEYAGFESELAVLRTELGETPFAEARAAGKVMTREQAIAYALESRTSAVEEPDKLDPAQSVSNPLTKREVEILCLISEGLSNRKIAERLFLSPGTIKWYLSEIYGKLDVNGRTQAVTRAREMHLIV
jgi:ATP/maltotriose-dependent transcriptional regulator MalT